MLGTYVYTQLSPSTNDLLLGAAQVCSGIGIGATLVPIMSAAFRGLEPASVPRASTSIRIMQQLGGAVPCSRLHARQVLWEWGLTALSESTELLLSELVTNAVQVSRTMMQATLVRLWLLSDRAQVVILVWDASPQPPVRMDTSDEAENGRGLLLVEVISARWGWHFPQDIGGKVVWAQALLE